MHTASDWARSRARVPQRRKLLDPRRKAQPISAQPTRDDPHELALLVHHGSPRVAGIHRCGGLNGTGTETRDHPGGDAEAKQPLQVSTRHLLRAEGMSEDMHGTPGGRRFLCQRDSRQPE